MPHFDRRLKSEASIRDQLTGMSVSPGGSSQLISNAVRHVFEVPDKDFADSFKSTMLAFEERDYDELSTTNYFRIENPYFAGIKTVLATPKGYRFQVEFHTPGSYKAKIANHDTYKELEKLQQRASTDALELQRHLREVCKQVAIPEGVKDIPHWGVEAGRTGGASATLGSRAVEQRMSEITTSSRIEREIVAALGERPIVLVGMPVPGNPPSAGFLRNVCGWTSSTPMP